MSLRSKMRIVGGQIPRQHPLTKEAWGAVKRALAHDPEALVIVYQKPDGTIGWEPVPALQAVPDSLIRGAYDLMCSEDEE